MQRDSRYKQKAVEIQEDLAKGGMIREGEEASLPTA
jgi:hypothetical protein